MENAFKVTLFEKLKKHHGNIQSSLHHKFKKNAIFEKKMPKNNIFDQNI